MEGTGNASGSSGLPRLRDCAAEQTAMATAVGLFQPSPRLDSDAPAIDPKMTKAAGATTGISSGATTGAARGTPSLTPSTSLKRRSSYSNMRVEAMDTEDSTPSTPASQMIKPPKEPPGAPQKARLLRPLDEHSFDRIENSDSFAFQLRTRLDSVFQHATRQDGEQSSEHCDWR